MDAYPVKRLAVNVGTTSTTPYLTRLPLISGKVRCRLMPSKWDGGPVVVCDRESRSPGEGVQCVRSINAIGEGRW